MIAQLLMPSGLTKRVAGFVYGMTAKLQVSMRWSVIFRTLEMRTIVVLSTRNGHTHCIEFRQLYDRLLKDVGDSGPSIVGVHAQLLLIKKTCLEVL